MPKFVLPAFPAILRLTEGASYTFTIAPDVALADAVRVRWEIVPQGRIAGTPADFTATSGVLDFAAGATAGQDITLTPDDDGRVEVVKSFVLRIYEVVGEDDGTSTTGESDDVQLGDDVTIELGDNDTGSSTSLPPVDQTSVPDIQLAGGNDSMDLQAGGSDDFYVITRYQSENIIITDLDASNFDLVQFDFGVEITAVTLNEAATIFGRVASDVKLTLSTGAIITINRPDAAFWRYQFGEDESLDYAGLKGALGVGYESDESGVRAFELDTPFVVTSLASLPVSPRPSLLEKSAGRSKTDEDVFSFGANSPLDANNGGGDDVYIVTRFQLGDVQINDLNANNFDLVKFDFGVEITGVALNETASIFGRVATDVKLTLSTGAIITIGRPDAAFWRYQFGDDELLDYAGLKEALGVGYESGESGIKIFAEDGDDPMTPETEHAFTRLVVSLPSAEPTTPPPGPTGPDTGDYYFRWVADTDLTDGVDNSGFAPFAVSDDAEAPESENTRVGNNLFELDDAVPADTEINGLGGDDVYLVKSTLAQDVTIQDAQTTDDLGYNLVRFDDDVGVATITATYFALVPSVEPFLSDLMINVENSGGVVVTVGLSGNMRFQAGETGAIYMAEEFFSKYAQGFASVAIDDTTPQVDAELVASITDVHGVDENEAINWQWQQRSDEADAWENIAGATGEAYTPASAGQYVRVTAGYRDNNGNAETVASQSTGVVETPVDAAFTSVAHLDIDENLDGSATPIDIGQVEAEDTNAGDAVAYSLEGVGGATAPAGFEIDPETGVIRYTGTGLDHEETPAGGIEMVVVATSTGADGTDTAVRRAVAVEVDDVNEAPVLTARSLQVASGGTHVLTDNNLHASDEDDSDEHIIFTLTDLPDRGTLQLRGDWDDDDNTAETWQDLALDGSFTQQDIADLRVQYVNTGGTATGDDSFMFTVTDDNPDGDPITGTFNIDIV